MDIKKNALSPLKPKIDYGDLFICDLVDAPLKDDMASMEHPVFTLSKKPDIKERVYKHNGISLTVTPSIKGLATIYDKDILIYATSKLMAAKNRGEPISKSIVFEAKECLQFIGRTNKNGNPGGENYRRLESALTRLQGTMLRTDIKTGNTIQTELFGLIDKAKIHRGTFDGRVLEWGITLSDWLYNGILGDEVLTLHKDYFRLRTPTEKRIYELARRHCGKQSKWSISLNLLLKKTGSDMVLRNFRGVIKKLEKSNHLPDYDISINENDVITFLQKNNSKVGDLFSYQNRSSDTISYTVDTLDRFLDTKAQEKCPKLAREKGIDYYYIKNEFCNFLNSKGAPDNISASFIGFIKQKKIY